MQLQQKIMSGEVYMFKSKPKLVLILKWVLAFILLFLSLACAFVSIGIFALQTGVIGNWLNANHQPVDSSIKIDGVPYTILFVMCIIYAYQHLSMLVSIKSKKSKRK
jgi:glucan phosphoethanolaminetransferase (alkaline phosphatase superfamily)